MRYQRSLFGINPVTAGELQKISEALREPDVMMIRLEVLHIEPVRPEDGMIIYADGTNFDPGAGEGVYARVAGAWSKLT